MIYIGLYILSTNIHDIYTGLYILSTIKYLTKSGHRQIDVDL